MSVKTVEETSTLLVPDLGVTLRTLFGAAAAGHAKTGKREWKLEYKGAIVGKLKVRHHKEKKDAGPAE